MRRILPLNGLREVLDHVVPQVVEAELVVGAVRDIGAVSLSPGGGAKISQAGVVQVGGWVIYVSGVVLEHADRKAKAMVNRPHPLRVALCEVVVHGHEMRTVAREPVEIKRQRRDERFTFTRLHFRDLALVEHDPAQNLHVERAQADATLRDFAHSRERLGQDVVKRLAAGQTLTIVG